jgi:hypothetical protein
MNYERMNYIEIDLTEKTRSFFHILGGYVITQSGVDIFPEESFKGYTLKNGKKLKVRVDVYE